MQPLFNSRSDNISSAIYLNENGKFSKKAIEGTSGLWNNLLCADFNGDGLIDVFAGNQGLNTRFKASPEKPLSMYVNDFDKLCIRNIKYERYVQKTLGTCRIYML